MVFILDIWEKKIFFAFFFYLLRTKGWSFIEITILDKILNYQINLPDIGIDAYLIPKTEEKILQHRSNIPFDFVFQPKSKDSKVRQHPPVEAILSLTESSQLKNVLINTGENCSGSFKGVFLSFPTTYPMQGSDVL